MEGDIPSWIHSDGFALKQSEQQLARPWTLEITPLDQQFGQWPRQSVPSASRDTILGLDGKQGLPMDLRQRHSVSSRQKTEREYRPSRSSCAMSISARWPNMEDNGSLVYWKKMSAKNDRICRQT